MPGTSRSPTPSFSSPRSVVVLVERLKSECSSPVAEKLRRFNRMRLEWVTLERRSRTDLLPKNCSMLNESRIG
jgi:hypothetical protein